MEEIGASDRSDGAGGEQSIRLIELNEQASAAIGRALGQGLLTEDVIMASEFALTDPDQRGTRQALVFARFDRVRPVNGISVDCTLVTREPAVFAAAMVGACTAARRLRACWIMTLVPTRVGRPASTEGERQVPVITPFPSTGKPDAFLVIAKTPDSTHVLLVSQDRAVDLPADLQPAMLSKMSAGGLQHGAHANDVAIQDRHTAASFGMAIDALADELNREHPLRRPRGASLH